MINHKHKFLYTHYPKCAGTSIRKYLIGNYSDGIDLEIEKIQYRHCSLTCTIDRLINLGLDYKDYYRFSFCRNPWALCVSYYFFLKGVMFKHLESIGKPQNRKTIFCRNNTFEDYISSDMCYSRFDDIYTYKGKFNINFVIRQESLQADFNVLCGNIGIESSDLSIINTTNHKHYTSYYSNKSKDIVAKKFKKEIDTFNYDYK